MNKNLIKINNLIDVFLTKVAQLKPDANLEYTLKKTFVELINNKFNTIKRPDKVTLSLISLSDSNSIVLGFVFGNKTITAINSDVAANIEITFNQQISANSKLNIIFNKKIFRPFQIEVPGSEFKLVTPPISTTNRQIRTEL